MSIMLASGAPAAEHMNQASGIAHGKAVWLPWHLIGKGNPNCFTSICWTAIIRPPGALAIPSVGDSINFPLNFDLWLAEN